MFEKGNSMLNLIYMILVCHALGYGHPRELMRLVGFPTGKGSNRGRTGAPRVTNTRRE